MNTISNYSLYTYANIKKTEAKNDEKDSTSSQAESESNTNTAVIDSSSDSTDTQHFMSEAYEQQNSYANYIIISSQPLNNALTKYRDMYPNIIGFTVKTQSSLNSLCREYTTKLCGLTSKFANCKTQEDFDKLMKELKSEIAKLMNEYESKFNVIFAIAVALPALSDVQDKCVSTEINMHDELEKILKGITNSSDNKSSSVGTSNQKVGEKLNKETISAKMQEMQSKNEEYKEKLKKAQETKNGLEIEKNQSLIAGSQKLIDVYSAVLKMIESLG